MRKGARLSRTRALGVLLCTAAIFLGVQLAISFLLDAYGTRVRFLSLAIVLAAAERESHFDVMFFGSSRTEYAVDAELVTAQVRRDSGDPSFRAFSAAVRAGDTIAQDRVMDELVCRGRRPALAVIEVAPEFLNRANLRMTEHVRRQMHWHEIASCWPEIRRTENQGRLIKTLLLPIYQHRFHLRLEIGQLWQQGWECWFDGHCIATPAQEEPPPAAVVRSAAENARLFARALGENPPVSHQSPPSPQEQVEVPIPLQVSFRNGAELVGAWLRDYRIGGKSALCLERILERCRRHGIVPLLLETPVAPPHRDLYSSRIDSLYLEHLRVLCERYGAVFVNARAWCSDDCLGDNHHLAAKGKSYFSERFAREVLTPVWQAYMRDDNK